MGEKLFPEYLNAGSKGPAVVALQLLLLGGGNNLAIIPDGIYGEETVIGVKNLQEKDLGMQSDDVDGNFGPKTRAELKRLWNIDVNALPADIFVGETEAVEP